MRASVRGRACSQFSDNVCLTCSVSHGGGETTLANLLWSSSSILQNHCVRLRRLAWLQPASTNSFKRKKNDNTFRTSVSLPSLFLLPAAVHVTTIPRRATPLAPNAKSGTVSLLTLVLFCFLLFLTHHLHVAQKTSSNLQRFVCSLLSLQEESLDLSRSCQTVWTRQDHKVC